MYVPIGTLSTGGIVAIRVRAWQGGEMEPIRILHQDEHCVVVDKPSGVPVHRSSEHRDAGVPLLQRTRDAVGMHVYPVHRLDRPVSGVVLFALSSAAAAAFQGAMTEGDCVKEYCALVRGAVASPGCSERALTNRDTGRIQEAFTEWVPLGGWTVPLHGPLSLLQVRIRTGRRHQIRRHLAHERHAVLGDTTHGKGVINRFMREEFGLGRIFLHAARLDLAHPETGARLRVDSGLPPALEGVLEALKSQAEG